MNTAQSMRTFAAFITLALIAGSAPQALATISNPATDQSLLNRADVVAPLPSVHIEADSTTKEPLIRVAPTCETCYWDWHDEYPSGPI